MRPGKNTKTRRGRILMLIENSPYPEDIRVRSEAEALCRAGYRVSVGCPGTQAQRRHELVNGVHVYRFPEPPDAHGFWGYALEYGYSTLALFALSVLIWMREGFDVLHAANPPDTLVFIGGFYKLFGKRFIYDHHDLSPEMYWANFGSRGSRMVHRILVWLEKLSCRVADHVIATNESYRQMDLERGGVPAGRITVVRNGPDTAHLRPVQPDPALRPDGKAVIAYVGLMGVHDGLEYLLRAAHHLAYDLGRRDFLCYLVGGRGAEVESLKALKTELKLDEYVRFTGWVSESDKVRHLSSADICVDPDPSDPFNDRSTMIKIGEYMAMGKPIVAFDLRENRFTAQDAAAYVPDNDVRAFAEKLAELMDDEPRRRAMGAFGRHRIEHELSWARSVPHLLSVYRSVLPGAQEPDAMMVPAQRRAPAAETAGAEAGKEPANTR